MATEKVTYWAALGLLALMVGSHVANRVDGLCVRGRMISALQRMSDSALRTGDRVQLSLDRNSSRYESVQSRVAYAQSRIACAQSLLAQKEAALAQAQALREQRFILRDQIRDSIRCPRQKIEVVLPQPSNSAGDSI